MGSQPLAYRDADGTTYFQQADWVGTQRLLTNYAGSNVSAYRSNPFGDGYSASGTDDNTQHYAGLEHDGESGTDHAQFRQYNTNLGQWMSLDPYRGSYDFTNPQSYVRYNYTMNNPLSASDPSGLVRTPWGDFADPAFGGFFSNWDISSLLGTAYTITLPGDVGINPLTGNLSANSNLLYVDWWSITDSLTPGNVAPSNGLKQKICSALPTGRTVGVSGGLGGVGSVGGGGEVVINYQSGQVSAFGFGGVQVGWNGGASGSAYTGFVYGLNGSNSNYSGGFTGVNRGVDFGGFAARSSGGLTGGAGGFCRLVA